MKQLTHRVNNNKEGELKKLICDGNKSTAGLFDAVKSINDVIKLL